MKTTAAPVIRSFSESESESKRIILHLKQYGEQLDLDIAKALRLSVAAVRASIEHLSAHGDVMTCQVIRFRGANRIEGLSCRMAGFVPPIGPGRKPGKPSS